MVRFGIIGRNFIVDRFLEAAKSCGEFEVTSIYSRNKTSGEEFAKLNNIRNVFTDIDEMIKSGEIDAVYIASPNSLHYEYAIKFLENKIAVLCEKPLASNEKEVLKMIEASNKNNTLLMEAMRLMYNPTLENIRQALPKIGKVRGYTGSFCQYSSRYDKYKVGIIENAFKPELSNGSLLDIGVYPIYLCVALFGTPQKVSAEGFLLSTGVDAGGTVLLNYGDFIGVINHSKVANSYVPSEIIGENGSIIIEKVSTLEKITLKFKCPITGNLKEEDITTNLPENVKNDMYYEIQDFIHNYNLKKKESEKNNHKLSLEVIKILDKVRKLLGVKFPADYK